MVIEHHWAARLRDAIAEAGGGALAQAMITPQALVMVGAEMEAMIELVTGGPVTAQLVREFVFPD